MAKPFHVSVTWSYAFHFKRRPQATSNFVHQDLYSWGWGGCGGLMGKDLCSTSMRPVFRCPCPYISMVWPSLTPLQGEGDRQIIAACWKLSIVKAVRDDLRRVRLRVMEQDTWHLTLPSIYMRISPYSHQMHACTSAHTHTQTQTHTHTNAHTLIFKKFLRPSPANIYTSQVYNEGRDNEPHTRNHSTVVALKTKPSKC